MVRFFPIYDFENNDANDVMVWDIDLNNEDINMASVIYKFSKKNNIKFPFVYYGNLFFSLDLGYNHPYIFAGRLFNFTRLPKSNISDFIRNIENVTPANPMYKKKIDKGTNPCCTWLPNIDRKTLILIYINFNHNNTERSYNTDVTNQKNQKNHFFIP